MYDVREGLATPGGPRRERPEKEHCVPEDPMDHPPGHTPCGSLAGLSMGKLISDIFDDALSEALAAAAAHITTRGDAYQTFEARYLATKGFQTLAGDIDAITIDRVAHAVAEAYQNGANYQGIVDTIRSVLPDFSEYRLRVIVQTELNQAYSSGMMEFGRDAGATLKAWVTTSAEPCELCVTNEKAGRIPLDQRFPSGHRYPCGHDGCSCDLEVHAFTRTERMSRPPTARARAETT